MYWKRERSSCNHAIKINDEIFVQGRGLSNRGGEGQKPVSEAGSSRIQAGWYGDEGKGNLLSQAQH